MCTHNMLRVIMRHTFESVFHVMRVVVNYREEEKQLKKIVLHLKSTLARSPIYDRAYREKTQNAYPGNPMGVMKPSLFLTLAQQDSFLEESTKVDEI